MAPRTIWPPKAGSVGRAPARIAGRYELEHRIGIGGMGEVFAALDVSTQQRVALKRLTERAAKRANPSALFESEFCTLAQLAHPYIVSAFDYGVTEGCPYYTMELLDGQDLAHMGPLDWREACRLLRHQDRATTLRALDALIVAGILKPDGGEGLRFSRPGWAAALSEGMDAATRECRHAAVARALTQSGADPLLVARHWLSASEPHLAIDTLVEALFESSRWDTGHHGYADLLKQTSRKPSVSSALCTIATFSAGSSSTWGATSAWETFNRTSSGS